MRLVVHDWGVVGLLWAMRNPERVERLVVINAVPFLPGYRWHRAARDLAHEGLGEVLMGATNRTTLKISTREAYAPPGPMPDASSTRSWRTSTRARSARSCSSTGRAPSRCSPSPASGLGELRCPALVVWGDRDPYIPPLFADRYAAALGGAGDRAPPRRAPVTGRGSSSRS